MIKALFPKTKRKVLSIFFLNPDRQFYLNEVIRLSGIRQGAIQRELKSLSESGILSSERRGRQVYYAANKSNPIYPDLRNIVFKTFGAIDQMREALEPFRGKIKAAFIYGSYARSEETANSDIDLLIVGDIKFEQAIKVLSPVEKSIGREINISHYSLKEFRLKYRQKNHFVTSVIASPLEFVIGKTDELRRLVEK